MTNDSLGSPLQRYAAVNTLMMKGEKYLDCSYKGFIDFMKQSSWKAEAVKGGSEFSERVGLCCVLSCVVDPLISGLDVKGCAVQ